MTTELEARLNIEAVQEELTEKQKHLKGLDFQLKAAQWLTFLLYWAFGLALYVGDIWNIQTIVTSFVSGSFGIVFFAAIATLLAYVLAGTKHAAYTHFSMFKTVKIVLIVAAFTGILAEVFNSSGVQDVKARAVASTNQEHKALVEQSGGGAIKLDDNLTSKIAFAKKMLSRCEKKVALGKEPYCDGEQGKLSGLEDQQKALLATQLKATAETQTERYKRIDQIKEEGYNPVIRTLSSGLDISMSAAVALLMLIFAIVFEAMHYYLSVMRGDVLAVIQSLKDSLQTAKIQYLMVAGYEYGESARPSDEPVVNRQRWSVSPAMGAQFNSSNSAIGTLPGTAVKPTQTEYQQPLKVATPVPEKQPEQTQKIPFGFAPSVKSEAKAEQPKMQKMGGTGLNNPVLGKAEFHYDLPLDEPNQKAVQSQTESDLKPSAEGQPVKPVQTLSRPSAEGQKGGLYPQWVEAIKAGECKPSVRPSWEWIQKRIAAKETGSRTHDRTRISAMQKAFFSRAISDGYMIENPNYRNGMKKFIWKKEA